MQSDILPLHSLEQRRVPVCSASVFMFHCLVWVGVLMPLARVLYCSAFEFVLFFIEYRSPCAYLCVGTRVRPMVFVVIRGVCG